MGYFPKKSQIRWAGAVISAGVFFILLSPVGASSIDDLKKQIDSKNDEIKKIQEELQKYNEELSKTSQASRTLKGRINSLNKNIVSIKKQISLTQAQIRGKELEITDLKGKIQLKENDIQQRRGAMRDAILSLAKLESASTLEVLLKTNTLSDFFSNIQQNQSFQKELQANLIEFRALKAELQGEKSDAEKKNQQLNSFKGQLSDKKIIAEGEKKDRQNLLVVTKNQEKKYQELVAVTEKKRQEIEREIEELEAELRKNVDVSTLPTRRKGFLEWPAGGRMSQGYGATQFALYGSHFYKFHNGIDLASSIGTPVVAAEKGTVIAVGNSDLYCLGGAYGKFIVIDHGNNLITLYAHLSLQRVSVGHAVKREDLIGYMGKTGYSTGSHLHFTVYDARTFELRQSKVCGILPYGGSVNPLDYL